MKKTTTFCDKCGKEIDTVFDGVANIEITLGHKDVVMDLCTDCLEELRTQIETFCQKGNIKFKGVL